LERNELTEVDRESIPYLELLVWANYTRFLEFAIDRRDGYLEVACGPKPAYKVTAGVSKLSLYGAPRTDVVRICESEGHPIVQGIQALFVEGALKPAVLTIGDCIRRHEARLLGGDVEDSV